MQLTERRPIGRIAQDQPTLFSAQLTDLDVEGFDVVVRVTPVQLGVFIPSMRFAMT